MDGIFDRVEALGQAEAAQAATLLEPVAAFAPSPAAAAAAAAAAPARSSVGDPAADAAFLQFGRRWVDRLREEGDLSYISLGVEQTGDMLYAYLDRAGAVELRRLRRDPDGVLRGFDFRADGYPASSFRELGDMERGDPRPRPWYVNAKAAGRQAWTPSYLFLGADGVPDQPGITCATPVIDDDSGALLGVVSIDFELSALSNFVRKLRLLDRGYLFIVETPPGEAPRILAHPDHAAIRETYPGAMPAPPAAAPGSPPGQRPYYERYLEAFLAAQQTSTQEMFAGWVPFDFAIDGEHFYCASRPLRRRGAPPWHIAVAVPSEVLTSTLLDNLHTTFLIGLSAMGVSILLVLFIARQISSPLRALEQEAQRIGRFELDPRPLPGGAIREISRVVDAIDSMKAGLRSFQKYVPSELVRRLIDSGEDAALGGQRRRLTVYFSDIEGFTSISESMDPELLLVLLSEYFETMGRVILAHDATLDKFIGDAIMAFWGAPTPDASHAEKACLVALRGAETLEKLNQRWSEQGRPAFRSRVGIATGDLVVGNIGFESRLSYTVIGDTVNIASRLEGLNKQYGTRLMIHEETARDVDGRFWVRPVDRVAVKGKQDGIVVYELIAERPPASDGGSGPADPAFAWVEVSRRAFDAYQEGDFEQAIARYGEVLAARPGDRVSEIMRDRCRRYLSVPPGPDWGGTHFSHAK
jgi:adenylate cyclase